MIADIEAPVVEQEDATAVGEQAAIGVEAVNGSDPAGEEDEGAEGEGE